MSDRGRVALIFVVIGLLAGGAGYYFFKIYQPSKRLKDAQEEIGRWETKFQGVRDCLLGKSPGSSKTSEALAIREMAPDPWDRGRCTPLISKLNRGEAPDTGIPAIEEAWGNLDKAAQKAALAFAKHVSESTTLVENPLPGALDGLDVARQALRTAAKMPATATTGKPLPSAQTLPIGAADGEDHITNLRVTAIPSAHGIVLFGTSRRPVDAPDLQIKLTAGAAPEVRHLTPNSGTIRSVPDMSWGASAGPEGLKAGALDETGALTVPSALAMAAPTIAAITGTLNEGIVVYGNSEELRIARAKNGTITAGEPTKIKVAQAGLDVDGRIALVWGDDTATKGQILKPGGTDEPVVELPASLGRLCLTKDRAWTQTFDTAYSFGGGRPTFKKQLEERLQGCTSEGALFHAMRADTLAICTDDCRQVKIPTGAPQHSTTTIVGGKLVAIASHSGVLGVWREGADPVFYALPEAEAATPVLGHEWPAMALTDGKVIDVLARGAKSFLVIRIPAT